MADIRRFGTVSGRVQGVGYRFFTERTARRLHLSGWVRNCLNGRVEFEVQGPEERLTSFLNELRQGPPLGRVDSLDVTECAPYADETDFQIRY